MKITKKINGPSNSRYIEIDKYIKGHQQSAIIVRYWNLLNTLFPNRFTIVYWGSLAQIRNNQGYEVATFSRQVLPVHMELLK